MTDNAQPVSAGDDLNSDPEMNRRIAGVVFGFYSDALKLCFESIAAMARWMLTALVAINGGAAVAVGGIHMPADNKVAACGLLVLGIILALGASLASIATAPKMMAPLGNAAGYWLTVQDDGERLLHDIEDQEAAIADGMKSARLPLGLAAASLLLFVVGAIVAAFGLI